MKVVTWIDWVLQRAVNATMFAIMRATGWPKSLIRHRIAMGPQLAAGVFVAGTDAARLGIGMGVVMFGVFVVVGVLAAPREMRLDEVAERSGLGRIRRGRMVSAAFAAAEGAEAAFGHLWHMAFAAFWVVNTFYEYAAATPPNPPAKAKRSFVLATEAG